MKKITSLLFALVCLCNTAVWAQPTDFGDPLITDVSQLSSPFSDEAEGTNIGALIDFDPGTFWHSDWHGKVAGDYHWLQIALPETMEGKMVLWIKRRTTDNDHPSKAVITGSLTADFGMEIPIDTLELGNASSGQEFTTGTWVIPEPVRYIRFTPIDCQGTSEGFRKYWHAADINLYQPGEYELYQKMMSDFVTKYDPYLWGEDPNIGTDPGQYTDKESFDAFLAILQQVNQIILEEIERPSNEEIEALINQATEYWNAYQASKVEYTLPADGYYRIIANLDYYKTIDTGEVDEFGDPITERIDGIKKSIYAKMDSLAAWHTLDLEDCRDVWYITRNEDNTVNMINAATEMGFYQMGSPVRMHIADSAKVMKLDWAGKEEVTFNGETKERDILYIRKDGDPTNGYYLHQLSHGRGTGEGNNLCVWNATYTMGAPYDSDKGTSEWFLEPVSNEEAQALIEAYAPIKNHDVLVMQYKDILSKAQAGMEVALEAYSQAYITKNEQFSSSVTEPNEGSLNNLLDADPGTFWHSAWSSGSRPMGTHFIDVTFDEPIEGTVYAWIQRRGTNSNDDNPILWNIYGSNDETSLESQADYESGVTEDEMRAQVVAGWEIIEDSVSTPWSSSAATVVTPEFNVTTPYKYMRFVCIGTTGPNASYENRGYFHMGGFQIYKTIGKPQIEAMGEVGTTMQAEIEKGVNIADEDITIEDLNSLTAAYEAFKALLKDPTEMRNTVAQYKNYPDMLVVGEEPGTWDGDAEANALAEIITAANEYDKGGSYDQAKLDEYVAGIKAAAETFMKAAKGISTDKWYRFRFPTEETYTKYNWSNGNIIQNEGYNIGNLWGQYVAVANFLSTGDYEGDPDIVVKENEEMREGDALYFTEMDDISNEDASLFRFIAIGDTAYIIQNKATGLYLNCKSTNNNDVSLSLNPTTFQVTPSGYGSILFAGKALDGTNKTNLHAQRADHRLVTWESAEPSSNSGLWLETVADVANDVAASFYRSYIPGKIYASCNPTSVKTASDEVGLYTVAGTYTEGEENFLALNKIAETKAGVPYIAIIGNPEDYVESEEDLSETFEFQQIGDGFVAKADSINGLVGTYDGLTADKGMVVFVDNTAATAEDKVVEETDEEGNTQYVSVSNRTVGRNSAYLKFGYAEADPAGTYDLVIKIDGTPTVVGIQNALESVAKSGTVYDLSGRQVKKNATLNDLKGLGRGIYILNGVKVMVK
ncbi:MAG: discoidin domain-containing protein [Bacteroidaceae bacterium]|nr:discoidin domain-containing protein [Bacteroidaceae bacterium]